MTDIKAICSRCHDRVVDVKEVILLRNGNVLFTFVCGHEVTLTDNGPRPHPDDFETEDS